MKDYIKLPKLTPLPDSSIRKRKLSDDVWLKYVFLIILKYNKEVDNREVLALIIKELSKSRSLVEQVLKQHIHSWYQNKRKTDSQIDSWGIILDLEAGTNNYKGFYDLKFQHSDWGEHKYFSVEAKNLGAIKSKSNSYFMKEYIYSDSNDDGGVHRFITSKYAEGINFGGMLGFIVGEKIPNIVENLTNKMKEMYCKDSIGELVDDKIKLHSIEDNENTFTSYHNRNGKTFELYHILIDFTS